MNPLLLALAALAGVAALGTTFYIARLRREIRWLRLQLAVLDEDADALERLL